MAKHNYIPRSQLVLRTIELLVNRPRTLTMNKISLDTKLPVGWLWSLQNSNNNFEPGADRIIVLYEYLAHTKVTIT
jgi:hypothetical protein